LVLFFLAPISGELLPGSAPPAEFFNPVGLFFLAALYGGGALLIRELRLVWGKGWVSLFILGLAYGIIEEGLMVKSFFDPAWQDLDLLSVYGRWLGVNWVWSLALTLYHAVVSIAIPICLVELIFPAWRAQRWLGRRGLVGLALLFIADGVFIYLALTPYRPPLALYLLTLLVTAGLIWLARRWPSRSARRPSVTRERVPRPFKFALVGFLGMLVFFALLWLPPHTLLPPAVTMMGMALWIVFVGWLVKRLSGDGSVWDDEHRLALVAGALGFFILLDPLQELDASRADNTAGMTLVALATFVCLVWLWRRVRRGAERMRAH
jgi:hypothetical protein